MTLVDLGRVYVASISASDSLCFPEIALPDPPAVDEFPNCVPDAWFCRRLLAVEDAFCDPSSLSGLPRSLRTGFSVCTPGVDVIACVGFFDLNAIELCPIALHSYHHCSS